MDHIETPDLSHLTANDYEHVYEPAEDSFLIIDALESELHDIRNHTKPLLALEVGSGSGVVITALAKSLGPSCNYFSTEINPKACSATRRTATFNKVQVQAVNCDLVLPLLTRLQNNVDVLIFNPPYVPTIDTELDKSGNPINLSWAGGLRGRVVMDRLFPLVPQLLSPKGRFYLLILKENGEEDIVQTLTRLGMRSSVVMERRAGREQLKVLRFQHVINKV